MVEKVKQLLLGQFALLRSRTKPNRRIWLFSSADNAQFNYNSKYLFLYVKDHYPQVTPRYVINDDALRGRLKEQYGEEYFIETKTYAGMRRALDAGVWFTSAGLPVYAVGAGKHRAIINLWHGVPLKKIALMEPRASKLSRLYFQWIFSRNYTYILTTAYELVPIMAASFHVREEQVKVWGQPRNDVILKRGEKSLGDLFGELPEYKKAVLYAPTYRRGGGARLFPFEDTDLSKLAGFLEQEKLLLVFRAHIRDEFFGSCCEGPRMLNAGADIVDDITEYLACFDVLITDYSSIYIDYLLLDRPIIFLPYDKEEYLHERGMNFDYDEVTPGAKPNSFSEFLQALKRSLDKDGDQEQRRRVCQRLNEVTTPCCKYICNAIYQMEEY